MSTKYYVDMDFNQLGGFADGAQPPRGAIEVPRPKDGRDIWDGSGWTPYDDTADKLLEALNAIDSQMSRIGEDAVYILIAKGLITLEDFPSEARLKLTQRAALRAQLKDISNERHQRN